jgi:hypothetical protein
MFRVACAGEFVGHGAFGIMTKAAWVPYFAVIGLPEPLAYRLMPAIGTVDVTLGLLVALRPVRATLLYMAFWGLLTATIRPLAGEPLWEFIERWSNYTAPLALLYVRWCRQGRSWPTGLEWPRGLPAPGLGSGADSGERGTLRWLGRTASTSRRSASASDEPGRPATSP